MKSSDVFLIIWTCVWLIATSVDFSLSFGDNKPTSVIVETKPTPKDEPKTDEIKATW